MSTADPNQVPPPEDEREPSAVARFVGSFVVDGIVQFGMVNWFAWIMHSLGGRDFHFWLFWLGSVLFYMALHSYSAIGSGRILVFHICLYLMLSAIIWTLV